MGRRWRSPSWTSKLKALLGYRNVLISILSITIVQSAIVVAGCTSNGLAELYLLSLSYTSGPIASHPAQINTNVSVIFSNITGHSSLEVRVGYLGICMRQNSQQWQCSGSATFLAIITQLSSGSMSDPLNIIWIASNFKNQIIFVGLIIIAVVFSFVAIIILSSFPGWHTEGRENDSDSEIEVMPFPSRSKFYFALILIALGSMFLFVSIFWQHIASATAASMVGSLSYGTIEGKVGPAAAALGWTAVLLNFVAFAGIITRLLLYNALNALVDDNSDDERSE